MSLIYIPLFLLAGLAIWRAILWYRAGKMKNHPVDVLVKQAAKLNWVQTASVKEDGYGAAWTKRSVRFVRRNEEAVIFYKDAMITLVRVHAPSTPCSSQGSFALAKNPRRRKF